MSGAGSFHAFRPIAPGAGNCSHCSYAESDSIHGLVVNPPLLCGMVGCNFKHNDPDKVLDHRQVVHGVAAPVDPVKPRHYKDLSPEPIDVIAAWKLGFNLGCVLKYVARADLKGQPITDLKKAAAYLAHEITQREKQNREGSR